MELKELIEFINIESQRLEKHFGKIEQEKLVLKLTVKLSEEVGELCEEVLMTSNSQREVKLEKKGSENINKELADVIFVTLLLAKSLYIDVEKALKTKMEIVNKRYE